MFHRVSVVPSNSPHLPAGPYIAEARHQLQQLRLVMQAWHDGNGGGSSCGTGGGRSLPLIQLSGRSVTQLRIELVLCPCLYTQRC
jgi:hypothetical protein